VRRAAPFALALVAVGGLAFANGGYDPPSWGWATIGLAWAAAAGLLLRTTPGDTVSQAACAGGALSRLELVTIAGLTGFAGWAALSAVWSVSVPLTILDAQRLLVLPLALGAFLAVRRSCDTVSQGVLEGVAAAATVASAWNLVRRVGAGPDLGETAQPLGYGNGVAILAGIGLLLALGLARERLAWLLACVPLAGALLLAGSRGGVIAVGIGGLCFAAIRSRRAQLAMPLVVAAGAVVLGVAGVVGSEERSAYWGTTAEAAAERPLLGSGAGTWARTWLAERDDPIPARDAHGLYLETLAELGPVGLALLVVALAAPLVAAVRAREARHVPAAAAAYAAFVLHAGVDWDLELTAVAVAAIACGAFLLGSEGAVRRPVSRAPAYAALAAAALVAAFSLAGNTFLSGAASALRAGDPATAESRARIAARLAPWSAEAWRLRGEAERELGAPAAAASSFREGIERDSGDVELWLALARVEEGEGRRRALERARRLNPLGVAP
jgi:O-antigen ligase